MISSLRGREAVYWPDQGAPDLLKRPENLEEQGTIYVCFNPDKLIPAHVRSNAGN